MAASYEFKLLDTEYLPVDDERIVVRMLARFTSRRSGNSVEFPVLEIYTVRDGMIRDVDVYYKDPGAVTALHGDGQGGAATPPTGGVGNDLSQSWRRRRADLPSVSALTLCLLSVAETALNAHA